MNFSSAVKQRYIALGYELLTLLTGLYILDHLFHHQFAVDAVLPFSLLWLFAIISGGMLLLKSPRDN